MASELTIVRNLNKRGYEVLAFRKLMGSEQGIVLVDKGDGHHRYVTWRTTDGIDTGLGHYHSDLVEAQKDFVKR